MTYAYSPDAATIQSVGRLSRAARRLDDGAWVLGLPDAAVAVQQACGWWEVTDVPRPADTATATFERTVEFVAGAVTEVWTERLLTDDELFNRERSEAPDVTDALVAKLTATDVPALWSQPTGAHDAYLPGAVALDASGDRWRNDLGTANVWPLDNLHAKWTNLDAPDPVGPQPWVQPTGSSDAYPAGATVTHNGQTWDNSHGDGNVWEPGVFGWVIS